MYDQMNEPLPDLASVVEANINAQLPLIYAHVPGIEVHEEPDLLYTLTSLPDPFLNGVYWANFPRDQVTEKVAEVLDLYQAKGFIPMTWYLSQATKPVELGDYLRTAGLKYQLSAPGMIVNLSSIVKPPQPPNLVIEQVTNEAQFEEWFYSVSTSFDMQPQVVDAFRQMYLEQGFGPEIPWQLLIGRIEGVTVAASRLFCAAGVAGIYHVSTIPEARRRGYGAAMTYAACQTGQKLGYQVAVLVAAPFGAGIYRRMGFHEYSQSDILQWDGN
jgi:ribosomal protein S18 acetylase RimI-like enzyme